jgi:hypothetical protein
VNIKSKYNTEDDVGGEFDYAFSFLHLDKFKKDYSNFGCMIGLIRELHYLVHNILSTMPIGVCKLLGHL